MLSILWTILIGFIAGVIAKFVTPGSTHEPQHRLRRLLFFSGVAAESQVSLPLYGNVLELAPAEASGHLLPKPRRSPGSVPGLLLLGAPKHLQGFGMHIIAMNMFDIATKLVVVAFVCALTDDELAAAGRAWFWRPAPQKAELPMR